MSRRVSELALGDFWNTRFTLYAVRRREAYSSLNSAQISAVV